jgi:3-deoxy-D-manno-octulosonate 8-phosphate phosphatase (KDO 8-P phosphatase)
MEVSPDVAERFRRIKLLVLDCDGVLTDGRLYFTERGEEMKVFDVRDGFGLVMWHRAGFRSAIISGRDSSIVSIRAADLGIELVWQGREDKAAAFDELIVSAGVEASETAYIGDDVLDVPVMRLAGLAIAPADAHESARSVAHYITKLYGGRGAVREVADLLLQFKKIDH